MTMKSEWGRRAAVIAVTGLVGASIGVSAAGRANAQAVVVGVVFENLPDGTSVDCPFDVPQGGGTVAGVVECSVFAHAEGHEIQNHCVEGASVAVGPVDAGAGVSGCSVTVSGSITVAYTGAGTATGPAYACGGAGLGTAEYTPASQGAGRPMSGPVLLSYDNGALTVDGAMVNLAGVTAGHIHADGFDPCGPDFLAHPFVGAIN